ncbi:MAG: hemerythrin domain-containing protein [Acidimicrobiales bacterium]
MRFANEGRTPMTSPGNYNTNTSDMFAVHRAILGALDAAPRLVGGTSADADRGETIGSFYENVLEFLHVHHSGEDELLYPLLEARCGDRLAELTRIDDQHKTLYEPMDMGRAAIAAWRAAPSAESAQPVVDAIAAIDETLRPHLADEEETVVPLCSLWLSPEEWAQLPAHSMMSFRADKPWLMVGLVAEQLTPEQRDGMIAGMPPELQTMMTEQWLPAFDQFISKVRG